MMKLSTQRNMQKKNMKMLQKLLEEARTTYDNAVNDEAAKEKKI